MIIVRYGLPISTDHKLGESSTTIGIEFVRFQIRPQMESLIKIGYRVLVSTKLNLGIASTNVSDNVRGSYAYGLVKIGNRTLVIVVLEPDATPVVVVV
ncbi:MAG: hypothetical protein OXO50_21175 [Caldilineaceae bacterium]|nr:hypothetical protein [Caldilineaceae bacterium]